MQGSETKHSKPLEPLEVCPVVNSISSGLIEVCASYPNNLFSLLENRIC